MQPKKTLYLVDLFIWLIIATVFPLCSGQISALGLLQVIVYVVAAMGLGSLLLERLLSSFELPPVLQYGIYIICGGTLLSFAFLLPFVHALNPAFFIYPLFLLQLFLLVKKYTVSFRFDLLSLIPLLPFTIMYFTTYEWLYALGERFVRKEGDYFYYIAIIQSLKENGDLSNAIYHTGLPVNYQTTPLLLPAQLAKFAGLNAQVAAWGIYMKLIPVLAFGVLSFSVTTIANKIFQVSDTPSGFFKKNFFVSFLLLFLGPLHFLYLAKMDIKNMLFLGEGYVLPLGSPGFALGMFCVAMLFLLLSAIKKWNWGMVTVFSIFVAMVIGSKLALFLPVFAFFGLYSLYEAAQKRFKLIIALACSLPLCFIMNKTTIGAYDSMGTIGFTTHGFYTYFLPDLAGKYGIHGSVAIQVLIMSLVFMSMWLGIKALILLLAFFSKNERIRDLRAMLVCALLTLLVCMIPAYFFDARALDQNGKYLYDLQFDMPQFIRGGIFIFSIVIAVALIYLIFISTKKKLSNMLLVASSLWMALIALSFTRSYMGPAEEKNDSWYVEVRDEFKKVNPRLMAMDGDKYHSGQVLTSIGVYPWYCTGSRENRDGYTSTLRSTMRVANFEQLTDSLQDMKVKAAVINDIKQKGVDYLIVTPKTQHLFDSLEARQLIQKTPGTRWFYSIK